MKQAPGIPPAAEPGDVEHHVLSLGAGTQSTLLYLLADAGRLEFKHKEFDRFGRVVASEWRKANIERAVFADTGAEPGPVMRHLEWLKDNHDLPIDVRQKSDLAHDLLEGINSTGHRFASIPAFTISLDALERGERPGILRRQCTREYKLDVIDRWLRYDLLKLRHRQKWPKGVRVRSFIGMSSDETGRAMRVMENAKPYETPCFPLIDMGFNRERTIEELRAWNIPHEVPRSACTFCPFRQDAEWLDLIDTDPEGFKKAVDLDRAIRGEHARCAKGMRQKMFLHRSCVPLGEIDFDKIRAELATRLHQPDLFARPDCMGACGT